ncbi:MAG: hypothetical protein MUE46_04180 [Xanthomonadales bacterium]|jgi:hypothetical protein|nr:hypothetical protein [Xanthomonadales bacterium]
MIPELPSPSPDGGNTVARLIEQAKSVHVDFEDPGCAARVYSELVSATSAVVLLGSDDPERLLVALGPFARRAGQSIYRYIPEQGLTSMREDSILVPQTKRPPEALRHIMQSSHFGVYLFPDGREQLQGPNLAALKQLARRRPPGDKRIVLIARDLLELAPLLDVAPAVRQRSRSTGRLKLRDGRWIRG